MFKKIALSALAIGSLNLCANPDFQKMEEEGAKILRFFETVTPVIKALEQNADLNNLFNNPATPAKVLLQECLKTNDNSTCAAILSHFAANRARMKIDREEQDGREDIRFEIFNAMYVQEMEILRAELEATA